MLFFLFEWWSLGHAYIISMYVNVEYLESLLMGGVKGEQLPQCGNFKVIWGTADIQKIYHIIYEFRIKFLK